MTGEKDRFTTTEKLWKLDDTQLTTPAHDEMVIWALNSKNISKLFHNKFEEIVYEVEYRGVGSTLFDKIPNVYDRLLDSVEFDTLSIPDSTNSVGIDGIRNKWNGLCDTYTTAITSVITPKITSEVPINARNKFIVGYADILIKSPAYSVSRIAPMFDFTWHGDFAKNDKLIEIKPTIRSFGETLRQLRTYKNYLPRTDIYLLTKDVGFKDAFENQGIQVFAWDDYQ